MNTAMIVGKSPLVRKVHADCSVPVCALNGAIRLCDRVDYLAFNDYTALGDFHIDEMMRVRTGFIVPTYLHCNVRGSSVVPVDYVIGWLDAARYKVYKYELPTSTVKGEFKTFGRISSVAESAMCYLRVLGFRRIVLNGIGETPGYHREFDGMAQTHKDIAHFERTFKQLKNRAHRIGVTLEIEK